MDKCGDKRMLELEDIREGSSDISSETVQNYFASSNAPEPENNAQEEFKFNTSFATVTSTPVGEIDMNELIIDAVRIRPALWDIRDPQFKNRVLKNPMWEEVAVESNHPDDINSVQRVHKMWDCLKANHIRWRKTCSSGSAGGGKKYKYAKLLSFLDDTTDSRRSVELCGYIVAEQGTTDSSIEEAEVITPKIATNRKRKYQRENLELKRQFIEIQNKKLAASPIAACSCASAPVPDLLDLEVDAFCLLLKTHLKRLHLITRIEVQHEMLKIIATALINQEKNK